MTTKIGLMVCALAAGAVLWAVGQAAGPPSTTGKVLVLDNDRTLEGDIDKIGDRYRVRRAIGETWVPTDKVRQLCASLQDAYAYLRDRANLDDPDEHLRLAQWCQRNELREQALVEVKAALALRPEHEPSRRLLAGLSQPAGTPTPPTREVEPAASPAPIDIDLESMGLFVNRVQPILMNACVSCHATGRGGAFKLTRLYGSASASRRTTQQNLAAVVAQINGDRPEASPLLVKAAGLHGDMAQPPLKGRQAEAYRHLEEWARQVAANNPQLRGRGPTPVAAGPPEAKVVVEALPPRPGPAPLVAAPEAPVRPTSVAAPPAEPVDPYDPITYNRQMYPNGKPGERK